MTAAYATLEDLWVDRRSYVESARRNKFEDGLRTLLADLYPDNAHFIYELLQNAEDARASSVLFDLRRDRLIVSHDGTRPFTLRDIEAITGIGQSVKKDDETQIGKFGVGFKAVFAYTDRPEIHSGEYSFAIDDLFVPEPVPSVSPGEQTVFVFPFDRGEKKPQDTAYVEIARGLRELGSTTLLFLQNIREVRYTDADGGSGGVVRDDSAAPRIAITETVDGEVGRSEWLRLTGTPAGLPENLTVAAAFKLESPEAKGAPETRGASRRGSSRVRVQPLEGGDTCIYFPAAKESSGLRFHIHAPFASTVARDSVRSTAENAALVHSIGRLVADALPQLRDEGFLDDGLLAALPNADDPLEAPYTSIRESIYDAFQNQPLTPVFGGREYAPASELYVSPDEFRRGIDHDDLPVMVALAEDDVEIRTRPRWIAQRDGRPRQFLRGLEVAEFGWSDLRDALNNLESALDEESEEADDDDDHHTPASELLRTWRGWIESRSDEQVRRFYELLGFGELEGELWTVNVPIIRVRDGDSQDHVHGRGVYLPADRNDIGKDRVPIELAYFDDDAASKSRSALEAFYKSCGVRRWDERAVVLQRIAAHESGSELEWNEHLADLKLFMQYAKTHPHDVDLLRRSPILSGVDAAGDWHTVRGTSIVIDAPYDDSGLAAVNPGKYRLDPDYHDQVEGIVAFATLLGATASLTLRRVDPWKNPEFRWEWRNAGRMTEYARYADWDLPDAERIIATGNPALLQQLWNLACVEPETKARAYFQLNKSALTHTFSATVKLRLRSLAWVLDDTGALRTAQSMTAAELPSGWHKPEAGSLAIAIGFGEDERNRGLARSQRELQAKALGISVDIADEIASLDSDEQEELRALIRGMKERHGFPGAAPFDLGRRSAVVGSDATEAPEWETDLRIRTVTAGASREIREAGRRYLREQYTGPDGGMHCQACHQQMAFKVGGEWYFEAIPFLPKRKQLHHQNYVALCPLCAAKYTHVRGTDDDAMLDHLTDLSIDTSTEVVSVPVLLNRSRVELKFTGKHALDLRTVLLAAGDAREA